MIAVDHAFSNEGAGLTALSISVSGIVDQDVVYAFIAKQYVGTPSNFTLPSDAGGTWVQLTNLYISNPSGNDKEHAVFRKVANGSEPGSYSFAHTDSGRNMVGAIVVLSGVDQTTQEDIAPTTGHRNAAANNQSPDPSAFGSGTTLANCMALQFCHVTQDTMTTWGAPSSYNLEVSVSQTGDRNIAIASRTIVAASTNENSPAWANTHPQSATADSTWAEVMVRPAAAASGSVDSVGPGDLDIVYDNELRVEIDGSGFEAAQAGGTVRIDDEQAIGASAVTQTVRSWSDTQIVIDVDITGLAPGGLWIEVLNDSAESFVRNITVNADPAGNVQLRAVIPSQNFTQGVPFSLDATPHFFDSDSQEAPPVYSDIGPSLPPSLGISAGGLISGTIDTDADGASPYAVTIRGTDPDANSVDDLFTWTVTPVSIPGASGGEDRGRGRWSSFALIASLLGGRR